MLYAFTAMKVFPTKLNASLARANVASLTALDVQAVPMVISYIYDNLKSLSIRRTITVYDAQEISETKRLLNGVLTAIQLCVLTSASRATDAYLNLWIDEFSIISSPLCSLIQVYPLKIIAAPWFYKLNYFLTQ